MAECVFLHLAGRRGVSHLFSVSSAATSAEEIGNPIYPPARRKLAEAGVPLTGHRAAQLRRSDYEAYDLLVGMENANLDAIRRITGGDPDGRVRRLLDFSARPRDIPDPWYTGDFDAAYRSIAEGCEALLDKLLA